MRADVGTARGGKKITLVGAGPVGALLAIYLARRGLEVEIFERRPDMRREAIPAGRSINLAVSTRGIHALTQVDLADEVLKQAVPMRGRMIHAVTGQLAFQPYGKDESEYINSISRSGLNQTLMTAAEATGRVKIQFNKKAVGVDFDAYRLLLEDERDGTAAEVEYEVLIGTDGSASAIRAAMMTLPGYGCSEEPLDYGYKELCILPGENGSFRIEKNALHIWPRHTYMLIALPNYDGSFTCTLFLPYEGSPSFAGLTDQETVRAFFTEQFPDAVPLIDNLEQTFFSNPTGHMVTVKCHPWNVGGRVLLLGDAAHAIVPFFGQGMNCGFEDCAVLKEILDKYGQPQAIDWEQVFSEFVAARRTNTDAIADMAVENFIEMRDKVADPKFLLKKAVEKVLEKKFPGEYRSRYALVTFSNMPYRLALEAGLASDEILAELCRDLDDPERVNLDMAAQLITAKLTPVIRRYTGQFALPRGS
ncbi:MAG TPA: NAD(P)/FAD-dependent oxidoreductase [Candidatus Obscuribacterales bacterium]